MPIKRVYAGPGSTATAPVLYIDDDSGSSALNAELVAQLAALDPAVNPCVTIAGRGTAGDQGGGTFGMVATVGLTIDNAIVFASANPAFYWQRIYGSAIDPRWFGLVEGAAPAAAVKNSNRVALQAAIDAGIRLSKPVEIPGGTFNIGSGTWDAAHAYPMPRAAAQIAPFGIDGTFATMAGETFDVAVDGGAWVTVTFVAEATLAAAITTINTALGAVIAFNYNNRVYLFSTTTGPTSRLRTRNVVAGVTTKLGIPNDMDVYGKQAGAIRFGSTTAYVAPHVRGQGADRTILIYEGTDACFDLIGPTGIGLNASTSPVYEHMAVIADTGTVVNAAADYILDPHIEDLYLQCVRGLDLDTYVQHGLLRDLYFAVGNLERALTLAGNDVTIDGIDKEGVGSSMPASSDGWGSPYVLIKRPDRPGIVDGWSSNVITMRRILLQGTTSPNKVPMTVDHVDVFRLESYWYETAAGAGNKYGLLLRGCSEFQLRQVSDGGIRPGGAGTSLLGFSDMRGYNRLDFAAPGVVEVDNSLLSAAVPTTPILGILQIDSGVDASFTLSRAWQDRVRIYTNRPSAGSFTTTFGFVSPDYVGMNDGLLGLQGIVGRRFPFADNNADLVGQTWPTMTGLVDGDWWLCDEAAGDLVGQVNATHLVAAGNPPSDPAQNVAVTLDTGWTGVGVEFLGVGDPGFNARSRFDCADPTRFNSDLDSFTIHLTFKAPVGYHDPGVGLQMYAYRMSATPIGWALLFDSAGAGDLYLLIYDADGGSNHAPGLHTADIYDGNWHRLTIVVDYAAVKVRFYFDNRATIEVALARTKSLSEVTAGLSIGANSVTDSSPEMVLKAFGIWIGAAADRRGHDYLQAATTL